MRNLVTLVILYTVATSSAQEDTEGPIIACVNDVLVTVPIGTTSTTVTWVEPTATDSSGIAFLSSRSHVPGSSFGTGATLITYQFTDGFGNTATCTFNVIVLQVDSTDPVVTCVDDITATVGAGVTGATITWIEPTATDDSGTVTLTERTHVPGSFFPLGPTDVTYTFTDGSGNSADCTFTVNIVQAQGDTIDPVIACIGDITDTVGSGVSGKTITWTEPTATDNSGTVTLTFRNYAPGSFFPIGSTQVTYTFTDGSGNSADCMFNVNVIQLDTIDPVIACIGDVTATVDTGVSGTTVSWTEPTAIDNSGVVVLTGRTYAPGSFFLVGSTPVTYTFTDGSGNNAECTFDVVVIELDTVPPVIACIGDITQTVSTGVAGTTVSWTEPTATDNFGTVTLTGRNYAPGSFFNVGTTEVIYTFTDASGNFDTCTFDVIVIELDTVDPITNCISDVTDTVGTGVAGTTVSWTEPTATDNSGTVVTSKTHVPGSFFPVGTTPVTYTFTDGSGNIKTCSFDVIVIELDTIDPVISCINDVVDTVGTGVSGTTVTWTEPTATDNSGTVTLTGRTHNPGSFFPVGSTDVTYTFTDGSGNDATCTFAVTVIELDTVDPVIACIGDITDTVSTGVTGKTVTWTEPTATDNSGVVTLTGRTHAPGNFFLVGSTSVTYTFTDGAGNSAECIFTVNIIELDTIDPVIACIGDITDTVSTGVTGKAITWTEPTATDNSGTVALTGRTHAPGTFFPVGSTDVTYTFTDGSGNDATCTFTVTVIELDTVDPVIACIGDITDTVSTGVAGKSITWTEPTATDNSGVVSLTGRTHAPGNFFLVGSTDVTYTFTDGSGNSADCVFTVTVIELDTVPPVIACIGDITDTVSSNVVGKTITWTEPTATDNSGTAILTSRTHAPGSFFLVGTTDVTYTFSDGSGNSEMCEFSVTVIELDTIPPVIACISDITTTVDLGVPGTTVTWTEPTATDNSGTVASSSSTHTPGTFFLVGSTDVTYTFTDGSGNNDMCTFTVNVIEVDSTKPVIVCTTNVAATVNLGDAGTTVTFIEPTATDNSGTATLASRTHQSGDFFIVGTTPVTYRFVDPSGNIETCTFDVTVIAVDSELPELTCPDDITVTVSLGISGASVTWVQPTATDNSGTATLVSNSHDSGSFFAVGTTPVTYLFEDPSGNPASCSWNVIVNAVDSTPPTVTCPEAITQTIPLGSGQVSIFWNEPTTSDNSGVTTLQSRTNNPGSLFSPGTTTVTYTYVDPSGNIGRCSFPVTVIEVDEVPPQILDCPGNIVDSVNLGVPGKVITWTEPTSSDNSGTSLMTSRTHAPGNFFPVGSTTVTYTFSDPSGNPAECSFTITVVETDTDEPVVICPEDITVTVLTGTAGANIEWIAPTATDNSGTANLISQTHQSGSFFGIGSRTVTYQFADNSGNVGMCSFTITVEDANPCFNSPCLNGGTCVIESLTTYTCLCQECYSGQNCEIAQDACAGNICANGAACIAHAGSCTQYQCQCTDCYIGQYCTQRVNPCDNNQCQNGALCQPDAEDCTDYYCQCPLCYSGQFCEVQYDACSNHRCENGGQCVATPNGACTEYTCSCSGCFTGEFCEIERDPCSLNPCNNNGVCSRVAGSCTAYTCDCQGCFTGFNCEILITSPCLNSPCQNGGVCNVIAGQCTAYYCICQTGFTGINCEQGTVPNLNPCNSFPCINGGSCLTMDSTYYICMCPEGYLGINCQTSESPSVANLDGCSSSPCANGADCYNSFNSNNNLNGIFNRQYSCVCATGYTGINCAVSTSEALLTSECTDGLACAVPLVTSTDPNLDVCNAGNNPPCDNGGICHNTYHSYDQTVDYFCDCPVGFFGHNCETIYFNPCISNPCLNGAQCSSFNSYYTCTCTDGFTGTNCNINTAADTIPPVISNVPSALYYYTTSTGYNADWTEPTATDNSGTATLIRRTYTPGSFFPLGTTAVTYVYTDPSNNAATATFFVTVLSSDGSMADLTPPVISNCPPGISVQAALGANSATATWTIPTATDNSGLTPTRTSTHNPGESFNIGSTLVIYTFTDTSGNDATCSFPVTVTTPGIVDNTPPVISNCPTGVVVTAASGATTAPASWTVPTATDNSGATPIVMSTHTPGQSFNLGSTQVIYTFVDDFGNDATCSFTVTVQPAGGSGDTTPPVISGCPDNIVQNVPSGFAQVTWTVPTATDDSGTATLEFSTFPSPSIFISAGMTLTAEYRFVDPTGNEATCTFTITGVTGTGDLVPPVISGCPSDIAVTAASGAGSAVATWTVPTASDNSGATPSVTATHQPGQSFNIGTTPVTYTFTDAAGNDAVCTFDVIVSPSSGDNVDPVIFNCPTGASATVPAGQLSAAVTWTPPTATDNVGVVQSSSNYNPGDFFQVGSTEVQYRFVDAAGNEALCTFTVTVTSGGSGDTTPPVISGCPENIVQNVPSGFAQVTWTVPTATDDSGTATLEFSTFPSPSVFISAGMTLTAEYRFVDPSGNEATCTFTITGATGASDTVPPVISGCPSDIAVTAASGAGSAFASWTVPTASDNSGATPSVTATHQPGQTFNIGTTTVTYTFTDAAGNDAFCTFDVVVSSSGSGDTTPPVISGCPDNIVQNIPSGFAQVTWTAPTATDDSGTAILEFSTFPSPSVFISAGMTLTAEYRFVDPTGNEATCTFTITGVTGTSDLVPPVISGCPSGVAVTAAPGAGSAVAFWTAPTASDNSGATPSVTATHQPGQSFNIGTTPVTYTFTDAAGNDAFCTFNVVVSSSSVDNIDPVIFNCPPGASATAAAGQLSAAVTWTPPTATDNVGVVQSSSNYNPGDFFQVGSTEVQYRFVDAAGNEALCTFIVTVTSGGSGDTTPPVISGCPDNIVQNVPSGFAQVTWTPPTATDNSGTATLEFATYPSPSIFISAGTTLTAEYRFVDPSGNEATCTFTITGVTGTSDTVPPVISGCPPGVSVTAASGAGSAVATWTVPTASDNSGATPSVTATHQPGQAFNIGTTPVTYTFTDAAGNDAFCTFNVVVTSSSANNPCNSSPCENGLICYYTATQYICLPNNARRRRRDMTNEISAPECGCQNGGHCMSGTDLLDGIRCQCPVGFSGILCDVRDPCLPNPCANNGTCLDLSMETTKENAYMCRCAKGWQGPRCLTASKMDEEERRLRPVYSETVLQMLIGATLAVLGLVIVVLALLYRIRPRNTLVYYTKHSDEMPIIN